jgi:hypothetical protein
MNEQLPIEFHSKPPPFSTVGLHHWSNAAQLLKLADNDAIGRDIVEQSDPAVGPRLRATIHCRVWQQTGRETDLPRAENVWVAVEFSWRMTTSECVGETGRKK